MVASLVELQVKSLTIPTTTSFITSTGEVAKYFFKNNPWKPSEYNKSLKAYQYCVICGMQIIPDEIWLKMLDKDYCPPIICTKMECTNALAYVPKFVPRKHYVVETDYDLLRVKKANEKEFFEDVEMVTMIFRFDRVYINDEEIPIRYKKKLKKLEGLPVETRIIHIKRIFEKYLGDVDIDSLGPSINEKGDPFLKILLEYYQKSIKILSSLKSKH